MEKSWTDQPDELIGGKIILQNVQVKGHMVEIRNHSQLVWLTVGNLFHSQTIRCDNLAIAIEALNQIATKKKGTAVLPKGAMIVK